MNINPYRVRQIYNIIIEIYNIIIEIYETSCIDKTL